MQRFRKETGMPLWRKAIVSISITAIIATCCGCVGGDGGNGQKGPSAGGRLVIGMQQEPEILNEAVNSMVAVVYVCNLVFSKFVKHDDDMLLVPDLIIEIPTLENGGISDDHLVYTYRLRKDAFWHDGMPVTSRDVEFSYRVMTHPDINVETRQGWDIVESVETPDPHTVIFRLSEVYANFAGDCFYDESVLPEHILSGALGEDFQAHPFHSAPVGSGPFVFHEWVSGSHITVRANRDYYGEGPFLDEITIRFIPDGNSLLMQLETGSIMGIDNAPDELLALEAGLEGTRIYRNPALFNEHLDVNCEKGMLADRRVRRAIAIAIDREEISENIYNGVWIPAWSDEHPDSPYHCDYGERMLRHDPAAAQRLLSEAGWKDTDGDGVREKDGVRLEIEITSTAGRASRERTEVVLREQLSRVGIDLRIRNHHPTVMFASWDDRGILKRGRFDLALYAFLTPPDPSTKEGSYSIDFIPPAGQNNSRFRHEELTGLLSEGSATVGFKERKKIYDKVARILAEELPVIPLLWVTQLDAMPASLENYRPNPTQSGDTWNAAQWRLPRGGEGGR
jgi:peptide/nickel transport system substrate-binding protein